MNTSIINTKTIRDTASDNTVKSSLSNLKKHAGLLSIAVMFFAGVTLSLFCNIPVKNIMSSYSYDVLVILIVMELFTNLICNTGVIGYIAVKLAEFSRGKKRSCLIIFSALMFLVSSLLNNITAVMMILPIVFVLLKSISIDRKYMNVFIAAILALSNTGGAASPIGDFPAVTILTSGITDFQSYLTHAFPLFALTSVILIAIWASRVEKESGNDVIRELAVICLKSRYRNIEVRYDILKPLILIFASMFIGWCLIPQTVVPPEVIAILGYSAASVVCVVKDGKVDQQINLKNVLTIASFLFFATVVSKTGMLDIIAIYLQNNISDPKLLMLAVMFITSLFAGIFSAGPAAAAMMPIITQLCSTSLQQSSDWVAIAYAAAICAGSSLFMWSATAGMIFSEKVDAACIPDENCVPIVWGSRNYLKYGLINYIVQLSVSMILIILIM